mmetsp:Transcript_70858/g.169102  ORF Transcript_70858/g.169102 Transcript_70858/m.169102 type:complete len:379 (+) Transcript_70858:830-1966(+)
MQRREEAFHGLCVLQSQVLHVEDGRFHVREEVMVPVDDSSALHLLSQTLRHGTEDDLNASTLRLVCQLREGLRCRHLDAIQLGAVEDDNLQPPVVRHLLFLLGLDAGRHHGGHALHGAEEDEAFEADSEQPAVLDLAECVYGGLAHAVLQSDLRAPHRGTEDGGHLGVLDQEGQGRHENADDNGREKLARDDKHAKDEKNLQPLYKHQILARAPQVFAHEARPGEEKERREEEPGQVVEELDTREERRATEKRVDDACSPVYDIAHDSIVDDVELQLHVTNSGCENRHDGIHGPIQRDLVVLVHLHRDLVLGRGNLQGAVQDHHQNHDPKVGKSGHPGSEVDLAVLADAVRPDEVEGLVAHLRKEEVGGIGIDVVARA